MSPKELQAVKQRYGIVGNCDALNRALETALKVARVDLSILIQGENGVGKEVLANFIHAKSLRAEKPYIKINCSALPPTLFESELFGYERGAFTGAERSGKPGLFVGRDQRDPCRDAGKTLACPAGK